VTEQEFRQAFGEHKDAVFRFAWRMTGSVEFAEDVTQDCFLALLRQPGRYDVRRGQLRTFLLAIARNLILKRWRTENRMEALDEEAFVGVEFPDALRFETTELIARAIGLLPPLQREALILAEYEEMSVEDIARTLEAEQSAVKARLHRARENLRRMLAPLRNPVCNL